MKVFAVFILLVLALPIFIEGDSSFSHSEKVDAQMVVLQPATASTGGEYEPGEDGTIWSQVADASGSPVATSTVTYIMYNNAGSIVDTGTLTYVAGSAGLYKAVFTAPNTEGTYGINILSSAPNICGATEIQVRTGNQWWEDSMLLFGLIILAVVLLSVGYALHKGDLVMGGAMFLFIAGGYGFTETGEHVIYSIMGLGACLASLVFMLAGATMWRNRNEEQEDDEIDYDEDEYNDELIKSKRKGQPRSSRGRSKFLRQPIEERRRFRREIDEMDA